MAEYVGAVVGGAELEEARGAWLEMGGAEVEAGGPRGAKGSRVETGRGGGTAPRDTQGLDCGVQKNPCVPGAQKM